VNTSGMKLSPSISNFNGSSSSDKLTYNLAVFNTTLGIDGNVHLLEIFS
jgi:hypothetical protein